MSGRRGSGAPGDEMGLVGLQAASGAVAALGLLTGWQCAAIVADAEVSEPEFLEEEVLAGRSGSGASDDEMGLCAS